MNAKIAILSLACALAVSSCAKQPQATPAANNAPPAADSHEAMPHAPATMADWAKGAQLFTGLGDFHRPITTSSPEAQKYFDQGMRLMYAFNHDEATRSFAHAAELDPNCAACYWGVSYTVGPNYNLPVMVAERAKVAYEALRGRDSDVLEPSARRDRLHMLPDEGPQPGDDPAPEFKTW